jgi:hypothetical protein
MVFSSMLRCCAAALLQVGMTMLRHNLLQQPGISWAQSLLVPAKKLSAIFSGLIFFSPPHFSDLQHDS